MFKSIISATENFLIHQIRVPYKTVVEISNNRVILTSIDIQTQDESKYRIYLAYESSFIQKVTQIFLEEDESDEETLIDMALETTNLIIGSAKVIEEEKNQNQCTIATPKLDKFDMNFEEFTTFDVQGNKLSLAIRKINA